MNRMNALHSIVGTRDSVVWGKEKWSKETKNLNNIATSIWGNIHALVFSAVLIACSVTVGCSSDKPKPVSSNNQIPVTQTPSPVVPLPAPATLAESKPAPKKIVRRKPATVNYTDKTYGVTFEYPRRYAIETGDAAAELLLSNPVPMNFVQPGGVALAAVELPETSYVNTDFSSAFFNVSVHKNLTADQCTEFAVPQPKLVAATPEKIAPEGKPEEVKPEETKPATPAASTEAQSGQAAPAPVEAAKATSPETQSSSTQPASTQAANTEQAKPAEQPIVAKATTDEAKTDTVTAASAPEAQGSKLLLGDMELRATEAVSGEGTRQSDSKYFHVFQNGACYEFGLNVTTAASQDGLMKHVDRDKVFSQLEKILATVKINPVTPEVNTEAPATTPASAAPAQ